MAVTPSLNISKSIVQAHAFAGLLDFLVVVVGVLGVGAALWLGRHRRARACSGEHPVLDRDAVPRDVVGSTCCAWSACRRPRLYPTSSRETA